MALTVVVSHILGGLGNQMFQYAAGRALSLARGAPLLLDVQDFDGYGVHQGFELARVFSTAMPLVDAQQLRGLLGCQSSRLMRRIVGLPAFSVLRARAYVLEPHFHYWAGFKQTSVPCYLQGYWQSERYFSDVAQTIRNDFEFRSPLVGKNLDLAHELKGVNAVSVHVRRGDYVSNAKALATHGLCSLEYYVKAIEYINNHVDMPIFFIFSDDLEWVKDNLVVNHAVRYVDNNHGAESYNDMRLMSMCRHHIIANSSFSWWGAWLNPDPQKIVVAPRRWFMNQNNVSDLLPATWVRA